MIRRELITLNFRLYNSASLVMPSVQQPNFRQQTSGLKNFAPPPVFKEIEIPERPKLKFMEKVPQYTVIRPPKMAKRLDLMRGPEEVHNFFIYKQYGIVALEGGRLRSGHFEMIRMTLGRGIDPKRMFGVWRIDPPWQPLTRKAQGQRMGGGKGSIDHYVTPVKTGRVIIEVAGYMEFKEVKRFLTIIANNLPFKAIATTHEEMLKKKEKEELKEKMNINPYTMEYIIRNSMGSSNHWMSPYDKRWFGKYQ